MASHGERTKRAKAACYARSRSLRCRYGRYRPFCGTNPPWIEIFRVSSRCSACSLKKCGQDRSSNPIFPVPPSAPQSLVQIPLSDSQKTSASTVAEARQISEKSTTARCEHLPQMHQSRRSGADMPQSNSLARIVASAFDAGGDRNASLRPAGHFDFMDARRDAGWHSKTEN